MENKKIKYWKIWLIVFLVVLAFVGYVDFQESNGNSPIITPISMVIGSPGYILYVIFTGDIHGAQPGPIGQFGRILVASIGSTFFWSGLATIFLRLSQLNKKKNE
ncbi:hypothetical protein [Parvicella tangerina]|uniref:Uncharacterized protein n=1 Tax=Parvicella tangerina TaxID=2829795 RepID=A0A916JMF5_9FLAO|nr:hypothetical protein [Parvicella tangerina]CAG5081500.1 hypothetical protein CRYO30217_01648 [Parvicella tangerina]